MKTSQQVKEEFRRKGITVSAWARAHGYSRSSVQRVIAGKACCYWGNAHRIAVLLDLKDGEIIEAK